MSLYRVGGWVRDALLGIEPADEDFVVVGQSEAEFLDEWTPGYEVSKVGKSFPVFIVSSGRTWKAEFAFARRERKTGLGHNAFDVEAGPDVTLEEDLFRRDLTCNAIALPHVYKNNLPLDDQVIDPFGGVADIRAGVLRHVSDHYSRRLRHPDLSCRAGRAGHRHSWLHPDRDSRGREPRTGRDRSVRHHRCSREWLHRYCGFHSRGSALWGHGLV